MSKKDEQDTDYKKLFEQSQKIIEELSSKVQRTSDEEFKIQRQTNDGEKIVKFSEAESLQKDGIAIPIAVFRNDKNEKVCKVKMIKKEI
jgi:hypothetical protein